MQQRRFATHGRLRHERCRYAVRAVGRLGTDASSVMLAWPTRLPRAPRLLRLPRSRTSTCAQTALMSSAPAAPVTRAASRTAGCAAAPRCVISATRHPRSRRNRSGARVAACSALNAASTSAPAMRVRRVTRHPSTRGRPSSALSAATGRTRRSCLRASTQDSTRASLALCLSLNQSFDARLPRTLLVRQRAPSCGASCDMRNQRRGFGESVIHFVVSLIGLTHGLTSLRAHASVVEVMLVAWTPLHTQELASKTYWTARLRVSRHQEPNRCRKVWPR